MRFSTLEAWLAWQETLHPASIELGLERVGVVRDALGLKALPFVVITVAGTNGKGSSVAMLEAVLLAAGYQVGTYTSPHLLHYNERIRINGRTADDQALCRAFQRIDEARGEISLTYFEFGTLAAGLILAEAALDVAVLEVGMGGRLDAVNLWDPDLALITPVDVDHAAWLGSDRETIGREKAGILRAGRRAVSSDPHTSTAVQQMASELGAPLSCLGIDYGYELDDGAQEWRWWGPSGRRMVLPRPALHGSAQLGNASGVVMALELLQSRLPVTHEAVCRGLSEVSLTGRFQVLPGGPGTRILDVAHNPQSVQELARNLAATPVPGRTLAVVGMLADKDSRAALEHLKGCVDRWFPASLDVPRGNDAAALATSLVGEEVAGCFDSVAAAWAAATGEMSDADRIVVFGSFYTVAAVLAGPL